MNLNNKRGMEMVQVAILIAIAVTLGYFPGKDHGLHRWHI